MQTANMQIAGWCPNSKKSKTSEDEKEALPGLPGEGKNGILLKSCKKPELFDLFIGLKIGFLALFLDHNMQDFK